MVLYDLRPHDLTDSEVEKLCEAASSSLNRNTPEHAVAVAPAGAFALALPPGRCAMARPTTSKISQSSRAEGAQLLL